MYESDYYRAVFSKLKNSFQFSHWVLGSGKELIKYGWDPNKLQVTAEPLDQLWKLTVEQNLEVYIPIFGYEGNAVLFAKDAEIFLSDPYGLYWDIGSQKHYFKKHIAPVIKFETEELERHGIPHMIDLTPSGWHILFFLLKGTNAFNEVRDIGYLEDDLITAYSYQDPNDIKRNPIAGLDAGSVFSGIGRLKEYLALRSKKYAKQEGLLITVGDIKEKCVNEDITDTGYPGFMRIMRTPFSLHKKRRNFFQGCESLQDVIMRYYSGKQGSKFDRFETNWDYLLACMWDKNLAVEHSKRFTGYIPVANDEGIHNLVSEYKSSGLYEFHQQFDAEPELARTDAYNMAINDSRLSEKSKSFIKIPNPRALQPKAIKKFVRNLVDVGWNPKHIGCLINDFYTYPGHNWNVNWFKHPSKTRAFFWARIYSAVAYLEKGQLRI